ncbi:hypothetical protein [Enterococcus innesii]|nr:hypothetical protein [Enterococcus innesii]
MPIEKRFYISSSSAVVRNMGNVVPAWSGNYTRSNWWHDGLTATDYFYSINNNSLFLQYGQNISLWATSKFFGQTVVIESETENANGSITATVSVTPNFFASRSTAFAAATGVSVRWTIRVNNVVVYTFNGLTNAEFTNGNAATQRFTVTVDPQQTYTGTALTLEVQYPNGEFNNSTVTTGFSLFNPNPISFRPWGIRKSNIFRTLDQDSGFFNIRKSGTWQEVPKMGFNQQGVANQGTSRIRKSNTWVGQSKIGS